LKNNLRLLTERIRTSSTDYCGYNIILWSTCWRFYFGSQ